MVLTVGKRYKLKHGMEVFIGAYIGYETFDIHGDTLPTIADNPPEDFDCRKVFDLDKESKLLWLFSGNYITWDKYILCGVNDE